MKKIYSFLLLMAAATFSASAANDIITFEDNELPAEGVYYGEDEAGQIEMGAFLFLNYFDAGYSSWNGFALSRTTSNAFNSYADQYNSCTGGGYQSSSFLMGYYSEYNYWMEEQAPAIMKADASAFEPASVMITNSANALKSMLNGDDYAKKFTAEDWLKVTFTGYDDDYEETGVVDFYLAKDGNIVSDWQKVDLTELGMCTMVEITMDCTDKSYGFMNTPAYFCLDNFEVKSSGTGIQMAAKSTGAQTIYSLSGAQQSHQAKGINIIRMEDGSVRKVLVK